MQRPLLSLIAGLLRVTQHGVGIRRLRRCVHRALGIEKRLRRIPGSNQQHGIISKDGRILRLESKRIIEVVARLIYIAVFEFELACNKIGGRA